MAMLLEAKCSLRFTKLEKRSPAMAHTQPGAANAPQASQRIKPRPKIDKSVLTIGEPKRIRSKAHLRFVARQPCLICGRAPSHAHHVRYAQSRGLGLKVSDEFTVPLCAIHHTENHATGNERLWWEQYKIDPIAVASALWHQGHTASSNPAERSDQIELVTPKIDKQTEHE